MKVTTASLFAEAYASCSSAVSQCFAPLTACIASRPSRSDSVSLTAISWPLGSRTSDQDLLIDAGGEKLSSPQHHQQLQHHQPVNHQPEPEPRPVASFESISQHSSQRERLSRKKSLASSVRASLSVRRRLRSDASSRRPQISAPTHFRHVYSGSFQFPALPGQPPQLRQTRPARRSSFRPLELSIYAPANQLSPMLPLFDMPNAIPSPPPVYLQGRSSDESLDLHQRSYSAMSFHVPRKHGPGSSPSASQDEIPPRIPPKSRARPRAYTSPEVETLKERVASAMIEVERLQKRIDDVIERQSLYVASRPSTPQSMAHTMPEMEPMPSIPALPPAAPSFAERLHQDLDRPRTAPLKTPLRIPHRSKTFNEASATFNPTSGAIRDDFPPPPPLPLVLRPPLRKKKSFSRVSTWLFPGQEHSRDVSLESITNLPKPVKGTEGFYQCVAGEGESKRRSFESVGTVSTWESDEEDRTVPTTWSPGSTPIATHDELVMDRSATFGRHTERPVQASVGVAV